MNNTEAKHGPRMVICPNCAHVYSTEYCGNCGQHSGEHMLSVRSYLKEYFEDFLSFDSRLFQSLLLLITRPGFLTIEFIRGKRKGYVFPSKLYLSLAFVIFFLIQHFQPLKADTFLYQGLGLKVSVVDATVSYTPKQMLKNMNTYFPLSILVAGIPCFALILKLLYLKSKRLYAEHLIFSFHFFAFMILVLAPGIITELSVLNYIGYGALTLYLFLALKAVYPERQVGRALKFVLSYAGLLFTLIFCLVFALAVSTVMLLRFPNL